MKENRLVIFQPTERPTKEIEVVVENAHGKVIISGKLGQVHKDLLDSVRHFAIDWKMADEKRLAILFDPYQVRKALRGGKHEYNSKKFEILIKDLIQTVIKIETPDFIEIGTLLYKYREANKEVKTKTGKIRKLAVIEFGEFGTKLIQKDISIFYNPEKIAQLKYGITKTVARYILSHKDQSNGGWKIDTIINNVVGAKINNVKLRKYRERIKKEKEKLKKIGILIKNDRIIRQKQENIDNIEIVAESVTHIPESVTYIPESAPF